MPNLIQTYTRRQSQRTGTPHTRYAGVLSITFDFLAAMLDLPEGVGIQSFHMDHMRNCMDVVLTSGEAVPGITFATPEGQMIRRIEPEAVAQYANRPELEEERERARIHEEERMARIREQLAPNVSEESPWASFSTSPYYTSAEERRRQQDEEASNRMMEEIRAREQEIREQNRRRDEEEMRRAEMMRHIIAEPNENEGRVVGERRHFDPATGRQYVEEIIQDRTGRTRVRRHMID